MARPRPETLAAISNGLVVLLLPLLLIAWADIASQANTDTRAVVRPPGTSIVLGEIERLTWPAMVLLPFGALALWRTRVYAQRAIASDSRGWAAVAEAAACAFGVMLLMSVPRLVTRRLPVSSLLSSAAIAYFTVAVALGVVVGVVLRGTALFVLWLRPPGTSGSPRAPARRLKRSP